MLIIMLKIYMGSKINLTMVLLLDYTHIFAMYYALTIDIPI